ncbi:MAG: GTP cyclohydrolase II [Alphaproteobacteria bacterium]
MALNLISSAQLPNQYGDFTIHIFTDDAGVEYPVLTAGKLVDPVLTRIHSACTTGDIFGSMRCDCQAQLNLAMAKIGAESCGIVIYAADHEGRGIGLSNKIRAYALQDQGHDTVTANEHLGFKADQREYKVVAEILRHFGIRAVRLLTNNPQKMAALTAQGIKVATRLPLWIADNPHNTAYLQTKRRKMGHISS